MNRRSVRKQAWSAGKGAGAAAWSATGALVQAVSRLADAAIDRMVRSDERVTSAAQGTQLLADEGNTDAVANDIQRVVVLATPVVRSLARGARLTKLPWVLIASSAASIAIAVRSGTRELQVLAALIAYRLEQATGAPADPALVKKVAIDLYLAPNKRLQLHDDRLQLVRLTRRWVFSGAFGRTTTKRAVKALHAAEHLDAAALAAHWHAMTHADPAPEVSALPPADPAQDSGRRPGRWRSVPRVGRRRERSESSG
jgi:hypothetical protein